MPMSGSLEEVTQANVDLLEANKAVLGLEDIYYGDERLIPRTPTVSVVPDTKDRQPIETGWMALNEFRLFIIVYHSKLGSTQVTRKECDALAEQIEALLHEDKSLGGLLYTSHVSSIKPGYARRDKVIMQATRLTWQGRSKTQI